MRIFGQTNLGMGLAIYIVFVVIGIFIALSFTIAVLTSAAKAKNELNKNPQNIKAAEQSKKMNKRVLILLVIPAIYLFLWILDVISGLI